MKKRKKDRHLPACVYQKHGAYWYVKKNKWQRIGQTLPEAMTNYARLIADPGATMPELIAKAHPGIIKNKAPNTIKQYNQAAERLKIVLCEYTPQDVKQGTVAQIKTNTADKPAMGNRILSYLRLVFNYAVENQIVESNPCIGIKRHPEQKRTRYITDTELAAVRRVAGDNLRAIIDISYLTGQRISDILSIRLSDITEQGIQFRQQKTNQRLLVEMTPELQEAIDNAKALKRPIRGLTLFCTMRGGRPYAYGTVKDMWNRAVKKSGIPHATIHDIRAKAATDAKRQGLNPTDLMGHTDRRTTEIYIREKETIRTKPVTMTKVLDS